VNKVLFIIFFIIDNQKC